MSNSPTQVDIEGKRPIESAYVKHWGEMNDRLKKGGSLSGKERNCAFLNIDGKKFATVSGVSGFDFPDDSRAMALSDWDGDGRMDVWVSNRNAPRVRFFHNRLIEIGDWIQFDLESNKMLDPIGARIELTLGDGSKLMRSLRAGEGFLGQSSRFIHFGLSNKRIKAIKVRWPQGDSEEFALASPGRRYLLKKGRGVPTAINSSQLSELQGEDLERASKKKPPWIHVPLTIPMPPIVMNDSDNQKVVLPLGNDKAYLINFWDPECADCAIELLEWKKERSKLPGELQIVTLLANSNLSHEVGREFIEEHQLPFAWGKIESDSAFLLAKLLQKLFQTRDRFEAPASFLINRKGELISFALGKVSVDEINAEVAAIPKAPETTEKRLNRLYGKGVWLAPVERENLLFVPEILLNKGEVALAANYVRRAWDHLSRHRKINDLLVAIGDYYFKGGNIAQGLNFYLNALNKGHLNPVVMNNVAWQLATHKDRRVRNGNLAVKWALKALQITKGRQATYYDTLAAGYAEKAMFVEALNFVEKGLKTAELSGDSSSRTDLLKAKEYYLRKIPHRGE